MPVLSQRHILGIPRKAQDILGFRPQERSFSLKKLLAAMVKRKYEKNRRKHLKPQKNIITATTMNYSFEQS